MPYKTILVHIDGSVQARDRIAVACRIAGTEQGHLVGLATHAPLPASGQQVLAALARFETQARSANVSSERRLGQHDSAANLTLHARYADLVIVSQSNPLDRDDTTNGQLPEYVTLHAGRPSLVLPHAGVSDHLDQHAIVAWDGSRAATRAISDALPLLRASKLVTVAVFNPEREYGVHGAQPGADIALFLARHDVQVEVLQQRTSAAQPIGDALLSLIADRDADLLVMGAYGHARWQEIVLGSVTRTVLQSMTVPVLMSH